MAATKKRDYSKHLSAEAKQEIKEGPENWNKKYGGEKMLISTPYHIMQLVNEIPKGRLLTMSMLRDRLATNAGADYCCPLTTGIFVNIVANASAQELEEGKENSTPWWRVIEDNGALKPKFPKNEFNQADLLTNEGFEIASVKEKNYVANYKAYLVE
jgi:alkylated DNA nucleotide flippase Atl1